jgi:ATP-dependent DNA helicase RecG
MTVDAPKIPTAPLERPVTGLYGVGPERAGQLARLEIRTVEDLLLHRPRRYEDRHRVRAIAELELGEAVITHGRVVACGTKWFRRHTKSVFELVLDDGTARLHCRWWNLPYLEKYFAVGDEVVAFGKPVGLKPRTIDHPETEIIETGEENFIHLNRITPIYPLTEGLPQRWLRGLIWRTLEQMGGEIPEVWEAPPGFPSRSEAIRWLHFPETEEQADRARRRLALDEFVVLQRQIRQRRQNFEAKARGLLCGGDNRFIRPFLARLGFKLTEAQARVLRELRADLSGRHPMRRLLQGDVGSGKTAVAACCSLMVLESGYQVALMAPTELLAEQHFINFSRWFPPLGIAVELKTGSREEVNPPVYPALTGPPGLKGGAPQGPPVPTLTIGTHALIESAFAPTHLGLVIIDEQHKFGVAQREQLVRKGSYPHLLVMTATPIPRTLGLTVYGELDVSVIDQMPGGRGRIKTFLRKSEDLPKVWKFIRSQLEAGRQAYVVYPRVEEGGPNGIKAVLTELEQLRRILAPRQVGLVHGRMKPREREEVMLAFRSGSVQVLLATSLIEVGLDVPNATVMLVENAEQFGLAQLHQLRGRIGRGTEESYCILVAALKTKEARQRLSILVETNDGFRIADADLRIRGPGELLGQQQSGLPRFRFGDLATDTELIEQARGFAARLNSGGTS